MVERFDRFFKTDDSEEIKKTMALLKPQTDQLLLEADAERVQKQKSKLLRLDPLTQQRQAEIPPCRLKSRASRKKKKSCGLRWKKPRSCAAAL
jgi:hypothetical protein